MVTADNVTDEQIRELRTDVLRQALSHPGAAHADERRQMDICDLALGLATRFASTGLMQRGEARARCTEIWNARQNGGRP